MAFFSNTPAQISQIPKFNQQQQSALAQLLQQGLGGLQNQQQFNFEPIAQQARTNFKANTIPSIAERFASMGSDRGSSALIGSLGAAGSNLEQGLATLKSQYGLQQQGQQNQLYQTLLGLGLQPQNETIYEPEKQSDFMSLLMALLSAGGQVGGAALKAYA